MLQIPSTIDETRGDIVMSDINVLVSAEDNMAEYQCKASNSATKNPLVASTKINVHCK